MIRSKIASVGSYVPDQVFKNDDLAEMMDTNDEWIQTRTGIKQRHWVEPGVLTSDLAVEAANRALDAAGVKKEEIDMIFLATLSPDHFFPGTACFFQAKMDMPGIPAIDVRQQCTGFVYGLSMADKFIRCGEAKKVLVVGSEVHSRGLDKTPAGRDVSVLFGDGAGAVVLESVDVSSPNEDSYLLSTHLHADGRYAQELWAEGTSAFGVADEHLEKTRDFLYFTKMNGKAVFVSAVKRMPEVLMEALNKNGHSINDVDLFVFHQANMRINEKIAEMMKIPPEKVFNTIDRFANTTAATIPIGLAEAEKAGVLKPGMLVASAAFGSGFTWASALYRW